MITSLDIDITDFCNFSCSYCYHKNKKDKRIIAKRSLTNIVYYLVIPYNIKKLVIFGGEPLLAKEELNHLVSLCSKLPTQIQIVSNLSLLDKDYVKWFKKNNIRIHCSLDGIPTIQNSQRVGSSMGTIENSKLALKISPNDMCRLTITKESSSHYYESVKYVLKTLGFKGCAPVFSLDNYTEDDLHIIDEQLYKTLNWWSINKQYTISWLRPIKLSNRYCNAGISKFGISTSGNIYPCHRFTILDEFCLGTITKFSKVSNSFHSKDNCGFCVSCSGGCPYERYITKDLEKWLNYCKIKRLEHKWRTKII